MISYMAFEVYWFVFLANICVIYSSVTFPSEADQLVEIGKRQYDMLREKTKVPSYGECWTKAIQNLHEGCQVLTEDVQSDVALGFMNCFLKMSGHETYNCHFLGGIPRRECLQDMSDRAFNVYTEFYTHTQSICFYLRSQLWHEETENTINRLTFASDKASNQLEDLLDSSSHLKNALLESHLNLKVMMNDFNSAAAEQKRLLFHMFDRLSSLQEWAIGEISWLDTVVFYLCGIIVSYLLTATPRTQGARFLLFMAFSVNIVAERYLCNYLVVGSLETVDNLNENLAWWVGVCRNTLVLTCFLILIITAYRFKDYDIINHNLLVEIQDQNSKLLSYLEKIKMLEGSLSLPVSPPTKIDIEETVPKKPRLSDGAGDASFSPTGLFGQSPRTTAAVLRKTEQVIASALQTSCALPERLDIVRKSSSSRESSSSRTTVSTRSRTKLNMEVSDVRYKLRSPRS